MQDQLLEIGKFATKGDYLACYRFTSCWMKSLVFNEAKQIPAETQFLLYRSHDQYLLLIPLIDSKARASLQGGEGDQVTVRIETFDPSTFTQSMTVLYGIEGENPYRMMEIAAIEIQMHMGHPSSSHRSPSFVSHLGWCTYNAFYENLSESGIRGVLKEYQDHQIPLGYMILDGGWQNINQNNQVIDFQASPQKFPEGLKSMIDGLKRDFSLLHVIAWQAFSGYWQGVHPEALKGIGEVTWAKFEFPKRFESTTGNTVNEATAGEEFYPGNLIGKEIGIPLPDFNYFFEHYHRELASQGVDGIKVDAMTWVEAFSRHYGGRVQAMKSLIKGLEASSRKYLQGNLLNCSSCSNDFIFQTEPGSLTRTSTDFFPDRPESHGIHLMVNAHTSFFMGEFILPDWDMFQTGHAAGDFHAACRAISGGPVYTTDELGTMNFDLLKKLVLPSGELPLCLSYAKPTIETLFSNLTDEVRVVKIFNHNAFNSVLGIFNCSNPLTQKKKRTVPFVLNEIDSLNGNVFILYDHHTGVIKKMYKNEKGSVSISALEYSLFTLSPVEEEFAILGLKGYYNIGGTVESYKKESGTVEIRLKAPGTLIAYAKKCPQKVSCEGSSLEFNHDLSTGRLEIMIESSSEKPIRIFFLDK